MTLPSQGGNTKFSSVQERLQLFSKEIVPKKDEHKQASESVRKVKFVITFENEEYSMRVKEDIPLDDFVKVCQEKIYIFSCFWQASK